MILPIEQKLIIDFTLDHNMQPTITCLLEDFDKINEMTLIGCYFCGMCVRKYYLFWERGAPKWRIDSADVRAASVEFWQQARELLRAVDKSQLYR